VQEDRVVLQLIKKMVYGKILVETIKKDDEMRKKILNLMMFWVMTGLLSGVFFAGTVQSLTGWLSGWKYCRGAVIHNTLKDNLADRLVKIENPVYNENGLLGSWHFDKTGNNQTPDTSGNGKNAHLYNVSSAKGRFGNGLHFNGTDAYVDCGDIGLVKTVEFYIEDNNSTDGVLELNPEAYISLAAGQIKTTGFVSPIIYVNGIIDQPLSKGFNHVVVTTTTAISSNPVKIGVAHSDYTQGVIDEVRIYSWGLNREVVLSHYQAKAKLNYADIRFTDAGGTALIKHWMEKDGTFWVKVPSVPAAANKVICVYYGNEEASDSSVDLKPEVDALQPAGPEVTVDVFGEAENS